MGLRVCLPIGLCLAFGAFACGGSDSSGDHSSAGGSSATASGGSSATAGGSSKAGSSSGNTGGSSSGNTGGSSSGNTGGRSSTTGGSGTTGTFDTGLPTDKSVGSLTDTEFADVCKKLEALYTTGAVGDQLKDITCRETAVLAALFGGAQSDADLRAACKPAYDACIAAPPDTTTGTCTKPDSTCTATVAEFEACANDSTAYIAQLGSLFPSCADLTLADLASQDTPPAEPASCTTFDMKCPGTSATPATM